VRIPPESGNMSDMLSPAVSDSETYDDDSEVESQGRNRLGRNWLESLESVLFDEVSEIYHVSLSFTTSPSLLPPLSEYARSPAKQICIWPIRAPGSWAQLYTSSWARKLTPLNGWVFCDLSH